MNPRTKPRTKKALIIGLLALLALAGVGYFTFLKSGRSSRSITVTAQFDEVSGLYVGNAVEILGMPVGSVAAITPKGAYVEVKLNIDKNIKVPADAMAVTISTSVLTDRRVELSPPYTKGPVLKNNDLIPIDRTRTPVGFDKILATIDKVTSALRGDGKGGGPLADLVAVGGSAAAGSGQEMKTALDSLSKALRMTSDGTETKDELTTIVTSLSSLTKAMSDNDQAIRQFGSLVHTTSDILAAQNFGTGTTGKKVNDVLQQAAELLEKNRDTIKRLVANGDVPLAAMNDDQRDLAEALDLLPLMIENFYNTIDPVNGSIRVHALVDKMFFDSQLTKEVCNLMGLRQLGCSTGTLQDYGPDFGLTSMLDSMARMGQGR